MPAIGYFLILVLMVLVVLLICFSDEDDDDDGRADQPPESAAEQRVDDDQPAPPVESAEQRLARAWVERQALVAWALAVLTARAAGPLTGQVAAPPVVLPLPCFPYAGQLPQSDKPGETTVCAICLDPLRPGQLCSEVPPCGHVFHGACIDEWARSNSSCPLCRAKIVPGSDEVAIADDMV